MDLSIFVYEFGVYFKLNNPIDSRLKLLLLFQIILWLKIFFKELGFEDDLDSKYLIHPFNINVLLSI